MTRTTKLRLGYAAFLTVLVTTCLFLAAVFGNPLLPLFVLVAAMIVPGRIQEAAYADLYAARRLLGRGQPAESLERGRRFLEAIRRSPWKKKLLWLGWTRYTTDVEAMALNNQGTAHMELGELDPAEDAFREALRVDPEYPLPYFNLAAVVAARGDRAEAERLVAQAQQRGQRSAKTDWALKLGDALRERVRQRASGALTDA